MNAFIITIISTFFATSISIIANILYKRVDFKNDYYKKLIEKRMQAYGLLEQQISILKTSILDPDTGEKYHRIFSLGHEYYLNNASLSMVVNSNNLWLNHTTNDKLTELIQLFNQIDFEFNTSDENELKKAGNKYYWQIAELRTELEDMVRTDILNLHKFEDIKNKTSKSKETQKIWVPGNK